MSSIAKNGPHFIGIDLGGTNIKIGLVNNNHETVDFQTIPTYVENGPDDAIQRMTETIFKVIDNAGFKKEDIARVGLASAGTMDIPAGMLVRPSNLPGWNFCPIRDKLAKLSGFPVTFANDATAGAYAEYSIGAGKGEQGLVVLTLGTGIGCGIILEGHPWDGCHSHGGESGHNLIDISESARWCKCGQRGHFEAYASATGVANRTIEMVNAELKTSLAERVRNAERRDMVPKFVFEEAEKGDKVALDIVDETARFLAYGMVSLTHTLDPSCFLIGGACTFGGAKTETGRRFLKKTTEELGSRIFLHLKERLRIDFAALGNEAGYLGAAGLARQDWENLKP